MITNFVKLKLVMFGKVSTVAFVEVSFGSMIMNVFQKMKCAKVFDFFPMPRNVFVLATQLI